MSTNHDLKANFKVEIGSNKNFGIVFSIFFFIIFLYFYFYDEINFISLFLSIVFLAITFLKPALFHYPNLFWAKLGILLGFIISPIIMLIIYIFVFIPTGVIFKFLKIDLLNNKIDKDSESYWKTRKEDIQNLKNQF